MTEVLSTVERRESMINGSAERGRSFVQELHRLYAKEYGAGLSPSDVAFTGKGARRRWGWYNTGTQSIYVNEIGLTEDVVRAVLIHELAHHYQYSDTTSEGASQVPGPGRMHGHVFDLHHWRLRQLAYQAGLVRPLDVQDERLGQVVRRLHGLRRRGGQHVLETGAQLALARDRCRHLGHRFEVFLQDCVALDRSTAYEYIKAHELHLPADLNFTTMRFLMRIRDDGLRAQAQADALTGVPLAVLRLRYTKSSAKTTAPTPVTHEEETITTLFKEKERLERRLAEVVRLLKALLTEQGREAALDN